ncbi:Asp23/Gls24 family envelope stress response protein [Kribbella qitaiheensis]|uniref:Asp23/Gls24 family envelope stress response protein n=1 Tax=Kribbella qitaiheensis TaxID=1544730 RepID=A0A7G6WSA7_9ACTN|nr:Asp23/Gls24 family envelope stress response protein [Kribbella qitaiheensis]QNE16872.1 Asp23/Gls24 family envelope stress response protein [Kribbella qitaiheensis]
MEMKPTQETAHLLPCGRSVEDVWDDLEAGRVTDHALRCPHCTTARAGLDELTEATRLLIDDPIEPPVGFLDKIMTAVRADLSLGRSIPLTSQVDVSTYALAAVLRYAVDGVDGVRAHECRIEVAPDNPGAVRVWMSVALRFGSGQVTALDQARHRVAAALPERIGLELETLDFEVVDVWMEPGEQR